MIPTRAQYKRWSTPTKWSFWAAVIGIPATLMGLALAAVPIAEKRAADRRLAFQVAQELKYNGELLADISLNPERYSSRGDMPVLKTAALMELLDSDYDRVTKQAIGEQTHIYEQAVLISTNGRNLRSAMERTDAKPFGSDCNIHDLLFLNEFFKYYLRPTIEPQLSKSEIASLGYEPFPSKLFKVEGVDQLRFGCVYDQGFRPASFSLYLGILD